jgi:hypothetical protein
LAVRTCGSIGPVPTAAIIARSRSEAPFDLALGDCADGPAGRPPRSCQHTRSTGHHGKGKPNQQHKNRQLPQARARFRRSAHCSRTQLGGGSTPLTTAAEPALAPLERPPRPLLALEDEPEPLLPPPPPPPLDREEEAWPPPLLPPLDDPPLPPPPPPPLALDALRSACRRVS